MTTVSDLVPQEVMIRIANRIARSARGFARKYSTRIPKAIKVGNVNSTQRTASISILIDTSIAPQAMAFEHGADPHVIYAKNKPNLVFYWENMDTLFVGPKVNHPGIEPRPFMQPAKDAHREQNLQDLREAVGRNVRLQIRTMAKKV
jgi:hypothetical protein